MFEEPADTSQGGCLSANLDAEVPEKVHSRVGEARMECLRSSCSKLPYSSCTTNNHAPVFLVQKAIRTTMGNVNCRTQRPDSADGTMRAARIHAERCRILGVSLATEWIRILDVSACRSLQRPYCAPSFDLVYHWPSPSDQDRLSQLSYFEPRRSPSSQNCQLVTEMLASPLRDIKKETWIRGPVVVRRPAPFLTNICFCHRGNDFRVLSAQLTLLADLSLHGTSQIWMTESVPRDTRFNQETM